MPVATHQINLHGLSGAIFWCILSAVLFYTLGFATNGWEYQSYGTIRSSKWVGLWATCTSDSYLYSNEDWFKAVQALITIGLILLIAGALAIILYMFLHSANVSKNALIKTFAILTFIAVVSMVIGFSVFVAKHSLNLNWSFAFCVIGAAFCLIAAILSIVQMKKSNVM